ncbi:type 2 isopentenyl-diphosphate Delta-isomerase [Halalkalibacter urbisdiaboli]|uniref:type 2 isopentenyl-diphosphate Delta-isomerase n=1 Tax=Halalkalibacter urbisdiaboli TaxID=1960589 RepID=UPI000B42EB5F|nr:type 2 isopentenyl-diphosphate Delta-isomerase [Halalkalibacter urbisdiaboli]
MSRAARKLDHINHALKTGQQRSHGFEEIRFVHQSLSEQNVFDMDLSTKIGELVLGSPIFINAMTGGGGEKTKEINQKFAEVAAFCNIGMAVGSQMAAIKEPEQRASYEVVRQVNPKGIVFANLGSEATVEQAKRAVDMVEANALQIHVNVIQELVMPEGDRDFTGTRNRIEAIATSLDIPIIIKEVGYGMSKETANALSEIGVTIVDVGGFGGTNFSKIENERRKRHLAFFNEWGIPTTCSILEVIHSQPEMNVIASGGIQSGLEVAKALSLGATATGFAGHFLKILIEQGQEALIDEINDIKEDLRFIMTALNLQRVEEFSTVPVVLSGNTLQWCQQRGLDLANKRNK